MLVMEDYYEDMTLPELKELLKASNLHTSGNKTTAIKRLREANWLKVLLAWNEYESMTIAELKEILKYRGETTFGSKKDLIARLTGHTKKEIFQGVGKEAPDALPMSLLPSINYHLRDYGINANDPNQTLAGLGKLTGMELNKMFQQLVTSIHTPYIDAPVTLLTKYEDLSKQQAQRMMIMSLVYTGDWFAFLTSSSMNDFLNIESRPNFIMNWNTESFTQIIRQQGPTGPFPFTFFNNFE
ncbi:SAP domain-containing protein [bacterium]|nr:SAP domain-containing protein [bacterium]